MKTILLLLLASAAVINTTMADEFVPSHRLAAELRFAAINAGETFEDYTPPAGPVLNDRTRSWYQDKFKRAQADRTEALLNRYKQEHQAWSDSRQPSQDPTLMQRINELEQQLLAAMHADKSDPTTIQAATDTKPDLLMAAGVGSAGALAGMGAGFLIRRRAKNKPLELETPPAL